MKKPNAKERCESLTNWAAKLYPQFDKENAQFKYGVYSETVDLCPLIGSFRNQSDLVVLFIIYLVFNNVFKISI